MAWKKHAARDAAAWTLVRKQHGVVARRQLMALGYTRREIEQRLHSGRLHHISNGVYAVGRPELTPHGRWMAAVLACGDDAVLSHRSAAQLWGFGYEEGSGSMSPSGGKARSPGRGSRSARGPLSMPDPWSSASGSR